MTGIVYEGHQVNFIERGESGEGKYPEKTWILPGTPVQPQLPGVEKPLLPDTDRPHDLPDHGGVGAAVGKSETEQGTEVVIPHFIYFQIHCTSFKFNKALVSNKLTFIASDSLIPGPLICYHRKIFCRRRRDK